MHVLHLAHQKGWSGETGRVFAECLCLREEGVKVTIAGKPGSELERRSAGAGIAFVPVRYGHIFAAADVARHVRALAPDVIHAHGGNDHMLAIAGARLARTRARPRPAIVRTKHNHTPLKGGFIARLAYGRWTDRLAAVSRAVKATLVEGGVPAAKIDVIHDAVDTRLFAPAPPDPAGRAALGIPGDALLIGTLGRPTERKGYFVLLDAMPRIVAERPDARFIIIGYADDERQAAFRGASGDRAVFPGFVKEPWRLAGLLDILIHPALDEALGTAVLEGMALAKPVVASRAGGLPEAVADGETGLLCTPGDAADLAAKVLALGRDADLRRRLGDRGRARAVAEFDLERLGPAHVRFYEAALSSRSPASSSSSAAAASASAS